MLGFQAHSSSKKQSESRPRTFHRVLKLCLVPIKLPSGCDGTVNLTVYNNSKANRKGYTRVLRLSTPQRAADGYTRLQLPDLEELKRSGRKKVSNSRVKVEKRRRVLDLKPDSAVKCKLSRRLLTDSDIDSESETSNISHLEVDNSPSSSLSGSPHAGHTQDAKKEPELMFSVADLKVDSTMLSGGSQQVVPNQKKKLAFDKNKFMSALKKSRTQSADRDSIKSSNGCSNSSSPQRDSPSNNVVHELIPPSSPKPLEFDVPSTPKPERKCKKQRSRSKDKVSLTSPSAVAVCNDEQTIEPKIDSAAAGDGVDSRNAVEPSKLVDNLEKKQKTVSAKRLSGTAKGLKRTARKTVNKGKYVAKELEMVREFTRKERQSTEEKNGVVLPEETVKHNVSLVLSALSNVHVDRLDENRLRSGPDPMEKAVRSPSPGIENVSEVLNGRSSDLEQACEGKRVPQDEHVTDGAMSSNGIAHARKRPHTPSTTTSSKTLKLDGGPKSAFECEKLDNMMAASVDKDNRETPNQNSSSASLDAQLGTSCDGGLEGEGRQVFGEATLGGKPLKKEADVLPEGGQDQSSSTKLEDTVVDEAGAASPHTGRDTSTAADDTLTVGRPPSLRSPCLRKEVMVDDDNYLPCSESKLVGVYRLPNGCKVATLCKDGKLYCAVHELAMRLRMSLVGLTRIRCSDEEGNMIRMMGRGNLKDNFEFRVVPLSEVLQLLSKQGLQQKANDSSPVKGGNSNSVLGKARGSNYRSSSSQHGGGLEARIRSPLTVSRCLVSAYSVGNVPAVPRSCPRVHDIISCVIRSAMILEVKPEMFAARSSHTTARAVSEIVSVKLNSAVVTVNSSTGNSEASQKKSDQTARGSSTQLIDNLARQSKLPDVVIVHEEIRSGQMMPPPPTANPGSPKAVIDMYEKMVVKEFDAIKVLEKVKSVSSFPVVHHKRLVHHSVVYHGDLLPNNRKYSTKTPFVIKCSSCATVFGPFDFMLHLEETDKQPGVPFHTLWNEPIERKNRSELDEKHVAFWNLFVDWFRLASKNINDSLRTMTVEANSPVVSTCRGQTTPTTVTRTTQASNSSNDVFEEIPASPAPFTSVSESAAANTTTAATRTHEMLGRRSSHPPTFMSSPSTTISHRPLQQQQPQLLNQQRYSSQMIQGRVFVPAQQQTLRENNSSSYNYSPATNNSILRNIIRAPYAPTSTPGSTHKSNYRVTPYQRQSGADDFQRSSSYPSGSGTRVSGSGETTPAPTTSSSSSMATYTDLFNKALSQQKMSMMSIEENFRRLEQENASIKSQLKAERQEKQDYALKLQKVIAESQSKDQQIQALQEELKRFFPR